MDDVGCRAFRAHNSRRRMTDTLTRADVERLLADPSPATRADDAAAIAALVGNEGAKIAEPALHTVLARHADKPEVGESLARRPKLPVSILEGLVSAASDRLRDVLIARHDLPERLASDLVFQTRERATIGLVSPQSPAGEALELVAHLKAAGRLTPSIML